MTIWPGDKKRKKQWVPTKLKSINNANLKTRKAID